MAVSPVKTTNAKTTRQIAEDQIPIKVTAKDARTALDKEKAKREAGTIDAKQQAAALMRERSRNQDGLSSNQIRAALEADKQQAKHRRRLNITV